MNKSQKYGVTSEGLHIYVDYILRKKLKINPTTSQFTVKMTGGPDGDVAGNELKILHREYGKNARIIAIADGLGAAYDPDGLNWDELLKLVKNESSICNFDPSKLSKKSNSFVIKANTSKNIKIRNKIHSTAIADIFIPAGGRPFTVNADNVSDFFTNQKPSCRAIIEGANIFFTNEARNQLQKNDVLMIKDSSANKTGVICSSFEILSSLVLSNEEFNEIKDQYIIEVIEILKEKARKEVNLIFSETNKSQHSVNSDLIKISNDISTTINQATDILLEQFSDVQNEFIKSETWNQILLDYCPQSLTKKYSNRIYNNIPRTHKIAIIAAYCASYIVYKEGLAWLNSIPDSQKYFAITKYIRNDLEAKKLHMIVNQSTLPEKEKISSILLQSGARNMTMKDLTK